MIRREFIRNSLLLSASTFLLPSIGYSLNRFDGNNFEMLKSLQLSDFEDEQDESPMLFQNKSNSYLTTLRRLEYPSDKEIISLFKLENGNWKEQSPVTKTPGSYECISADCQKDGLPLVAWAEVKNEQWVINASIQNNGGFSSPVEISNVSKRSINPIVKAVTSDSYLLAWESFEKGKFSIYVSKYENSTWSEPAQVTDKSQSCFDPALEQDKQGNIYVAYDITDGSHRNIEMKILNSSLNEIKTVPIAVGGGFEDRVNINVKPSLGFDTSNRLWISYENNRFAHRLEDSDNYTGDRCCAMVCYVDGELYEQQEIGRWLFKGMNDHWPTFQKDLNDNLYMITHCGGDFIGNPHWKFRVAYLDPKTGWSQPEIILQTKQKGESIRPTITFDAKNESFWLAWKSENFQDRDYDHPNEHDNRKDSVRRGMLEMNQFTAPIISKNRDVISFVSTVIEEHHSIDGFAPILSGRSKSKRTTMIHNGETYTLLLGNLHEHSEISSCWPAGTDGTLHDDYRYGLYSEGYDFMGITDHAYSQTEVYWRKHLRLAEFYNDSSHFVAFPSVEFTLSNDRELEIRRGAGHRNVIFNSMEDAKKYIRDKNQVYSVRNPETRDAEGLWKYIRENNIDCISIPHHPADEVHACCWESRDEEIEPIVEIFQCRGNAEYRGAPRMMNLDRHKPTENDHGFIDYALREKGHKLGFIASGDHNSIGVGLACVWVKEVSRKGVLEAVRSRRVFGTTGDQIEVDFRLNGVLQGQTTRLSKTYNLAINVSAVDEIESIDILRNSRVIESIKLENGTDFFSGNFMDKKIKNNEKVLYYYVRVMQKNKHIAWSSPVWIES
tara:strand:- start:11093 stop:13600 length:2508 start_codon:yes stop_codon:yes gene_type:complete